MDNMTWDLDIFYKGYDDPKYNKDIEELKQLIESICAEEFDDKKPIDTIEESLKLEERVNYLLNDLYCSFINESSSFFRIGEHPSILDMIFLSSKKSQYSYKSAVFFDSPE